MNKAFAAFFLFFLLTSYLFASQDIFVTAVRESNVPEDLTSAASLFDRFDIEESGAATLKGFLSQVTELNLFSTGPGQVTSVQLRGNDNRHTLIVVDGVPLSDATAPDGASRFESLSLFDVEKIEVLYGAQSVLYGSQAIGGVIKITTQKKGKGSRLGFGLGNYGRQNLNALHRGSFGDLNYKVFLGGENTFGPSSRVKSSTRARDDDQTVRFDANVTLNYKNVTFNQRFQKLDYEFDSSVVDELDDSGIYENLTQSLTYQNSLVSAFLSRSHFKRRLDIVDGGSLSRFTYDGETIRARVQSSWIFENMKGLSLTTGLEGRLDKAKELDVVLRGSPKRSIGELFIDSRFDPSKKVTLELGSRVTKNEGDSSILTYRLASTIRLDWNMRIKGSFASGLKIPELYHFYTQFGSNKDLRSERAKSFDLTFEYESESGFDFRSSLFGSKYRNYIDYDLGDSRYENVGKASLYGFSQTLNKKINDLFKFTASYTYLRTQNELTNKYLRLRPTYSYNMRLDYAAFKNWDFYFSYVYKGERDDTKRVLRSFRLFNIGTSFQQNESVSFRFIVNNLFNRKYSEVDGFSTFGLNAMGQMEVVF